ncbi:patatin-like phospholipase family protein [Marinoscillum sp.]|uniref:patatin-like phospholipase family protein n=1 Tax=Marinoscillum sp. TaxID=2024838 RepID=UPI003BAC1F97
MTKDKQYKIGIVLSGGGARGFAHIGALQALHEQKVYPEIISGVSAGSIVGAFYAYGMAPEDILDLLKEKGVFDYSTLSLPLTGLLSLEGLKKELKNNIDCGDISELSKPAYFATTNLNTGNIEYLNEGPIPLVIAASSCIPILFKPIEMNGSLYIDGGTYDNFPIKPIKDKCEKIIGINISPLEDVKKLDSMLQIATRVFQLSVNATAQPSLSQCDVLIEPKKLSSFSILDSSVADELFEIGYHAAKNQLKNVEL